MDCFEGKNGQSSATKTALTAKHADFLNNSFDFLLTRDEIKNLITVLEHSTQLNSSDFFPKTNCFCGTNDQNSYLRTTLADKGEIFF
jgi:hypothetical protein